MSQAHKKIAVGFIITALLFIGFVIWYFFQDARNKAPLVTDSPAASLAFPKLAFNSYQIETSLPVLPVALQSYSFVSRYDEVAANLAKKLNLNEKKTVAAGLVSFQNTTDPSDLGILTYDLKNGSFTFQSYGMVRAEEDPDKAQNVLKTLGLDDGTIACTDSYKRRGMEEVTYYECHRDWKLIGLPIINAIGSVNIAQDIAVQDLKLGLSGSQSLIDPGIILSSNNEDGKVRANDFNTITVGIVDSTQQVITISSNIPSIDKRNILVGSRDLSSPQEALEKFKNREQEIDIAAPAGRGTPDLRKVFNTPVARSKTATVTDYNLVYIQTPPEVVQKVLTPYYWLRGTATLESGYAVSFNQFLPATKKQLSISGASLLSGEVAGEFTEYTEKSPTYDKYQRGSMKQGTFWSVFTAIPSPTNPPPSVFPTSIPITSVVPPTLTLVPSPTTTVPTIILPTPTTPPQLSQCNKLNPYSKDITLTIEGVGPIQLAYSGTTFYFKNKELPSAQLALIKDALFKRITEQYAINISRKMTITDPNQPPEYWKLPANASETDIYNFLKTRAATYCNAGDTIPSPECINDNEEQTRLYYNRARMQQALTDVARRIFELNTSNSLAAFASQTNLFTEETMTNFNWVFIDSPEASNSNLFSSECYITGTSPALFIYAPSEIKLSVELGMPLTYTYPPILNDNRWQLTTHKNNLRLSHEYTDTPYLYYEYDPKNITIPIPNKGWSIKTSGIDSWINTFAVKNNIIETEKTRLSQDFHAALIDQKKPSPYINVYLADKKDIEKLLPLHITPRPDSLYRFHFLLLPKTKQEILTPPIVPIIMRNGITVIEIGARLLH